MDATGRSGGVNFDQISVWFNMWGFAFFKDPGCLQRTPGSLQRSPGALLSYKPRVLPKEPRVLLQDPGVILNNPGILLEDPKGPKPEHGVSGSATTQPGTGLLGARAPEVWSILEGSALGRPEDTFLKLSQMSWVAG